MITKHEGDIFLAPADIIIHQANCFHTMGAGIAKRIKDQFPEVYETDCRTKKGDQGKMASFNFTKVSFDKNPKLKYICNLYGQYNYGRKGRYTSYDALEEGLRAMEDVAKSKPNIPTLAVPYKMGCVNAGGSWNIVSAILHDIFGNSPVGLLICKYEI